MYIRKLRILDGLSGLIMREVEFHQGANLVVDAETSLSHNKVGKTTFLRLIDVLMGANEKKLIYTDPASNSINVELQQIIVDRNVTAEMTLTESMSSSAAKTVTLRVELFPRGHYFINGERLTAKAYREKLNVILFGLEDNVPTFRQLINSFVRVQVGGDTDAFLRMLPRESYATYHSVYNHLFKISDPQLDKTLNELNKRLNHQKELLRQYKRVNGIEDTEQQQQIMVALQAEYELLQTKSNDILDAEEYKANRATISDVRARFQALSEQLESVNYRKSRNRDALAEARREKERKADLDLARQFYDEVCSAVPGIDKTFDDMVAFNSNLIDNKIAYFGEVAAELSKQQHDIQREINQLVESNGRYLALLADDDLDEFERLQERLGQLRQDMGRLRQAIGTLREFESEIDATDQDIARYSTGGEARETGSENYKERMASFNKYFTPLAERINGERPILVYHPDTDKFPVSISDIPGSSTGTRKSLMAAYDLAYQLFAADNEIQRPHFIVHDVVENIEGDNLHAIVDAANSIDCQYIIAVLKEKLDSSDIAQDDQDRMQVLRLSVDDRLFQGKTVDGARQCPEDSSRLIALKTSTSTT